MSKFNKILIIILLIVFSFGLSIYAADAVTGEWFYYTDLANKGDSKVMIDGKEKSACQLYPEKIDGADVQVAILSGYVTTKFSYGFLGMGMKIAPDMVAKLQKAKGFKFMCVGDGKQYRCRVELSSVKDFDHYGRVFKATETPTEVLIKYSFLAQEGWGAKVAFNPKFINQISFQTVGQPHKSVLLKVYNVEILY